MYLHLGADTIVKKEDIVGIFELDGKVTTKEAAEFLKRAQREGKTFSAGDDLPKSFVIVKTPEGEKVYFSHIAVLSLVKRSALPF